jgi:hypothetical protein
VRQDVLCSPKLIENDLNVAVEAPKSSESTIRYKKNVDARFMWLNLRRLGYWMNTLIMTCPTFTVTPTVFKLSAIHLLAVDLRSS